MVLVSFKQQRGKRHATFDFIYKKKIEALWFRVSRRKRRRRRRRIGKKKKTKNRKKNNCVTSIILLLQRGRRENHGGQSGANLRASTGIGTARRVQIESMVLRLRRARKRRVRDFRERDWIVSLGDATTTTTTTTHRKGRCLDATTDDDFDEQEEIGRWEMGVFHL